MFCCRRCSSIKHVADAEHPSAPFDNRNQSDRRQQSQNCCRTRVFQKNRNPSEGAQIPRRRWHRCNIRSKQMEAAPAVRRRELFLEDQRRMPDLQPDQWWRGRVASTSVFASRFSIYCRAKVKARLMFCSFCIAMKLTEACAMHNSQRVNRISPCGRSLPFSQRTTVITVHVFPFCYKWNIRSVDRVQYIALYRTSGRHRLIISELTASTDAQASLPGFLRRACFKLVTPMSRWQSAASSSNDIERPCDATAHLTPTHS